MIIGPINECKPTCGNKKGDAINPTRSSLTNSMGIRSRPIGHIARFQDEILNAVDLLRAVLMTENGQPQMIHADIPKIAANTINFGFFWSAFTPNPAATWGFVPARKICKAGGKKYASRISPSI